MNNRYPRTHILLSQDSGDLNGLLPLLQQLDRQLDQAVAAAQVAYGPEAATDPYRGLHLNSEDVERLLTREPGAPTFQGYGELDDETPSNVVQQDSPLAWLQQTFELSPFDVEIIAIALAPELDRRYERLYAYLQDDVRCKRPSVDLALNLLCPTAAEKLARRIHFASDAPLIRHNLLHLVHATRSPTALRRPSCPFPPQTTRTRCTNSPLLSTH